jgi:hypothetical protein
VVDVPFNYILNDASQQITTLLYIKRACELNRSHIISTDEDPGLRIESFAVINLRGVSTNKTIIILVLLKNPCSNTCSDEDQVYIYLTLQTLNQLELNVY